LKHSRRYWYYYIEDGHRVVYDPAQDYTAEPTTGRKLNFIDVLNETSRASTSALSARESDRSSCYGNITAIVMGRGFAPERIVAPKPQRPHLTVLVINAQYDEAASEEPDHSRIQQPELFSSSATSVLEDESDCDSPEVNSKSLAGSLRGTSPSSATGGRCCVCKRRFHTRE
ncbi:hypothetical protein E8E12_000032, partial [Didymella heteroderae]